MYLWAINFVHRSVKNVMAGESVCTGTNNIVIKYTATAYTMLPKAIDGICMYIAGSMAFWGAYNTMKMVMFSYASKTN
jgi:hypothetical protein